jgi:hypothetical protein
MIFHPRPILVEVFEIDARSIDGPKIEGDAVENLEKWTSLIRCSFIRSNLLFAAGKTTEALPSGPTKRSSGSVVKFQTTG